MNEAAMSEPLRIFLRDHIACYEELQLLLLLRERGSAWCDLASLCEHLPVSRETLRGSLEQLCEVELIQAASDRYRYAPASNDAAAVVDELAVLCAEQPLVVVKVMTANALERLRLRSLSTFDRVLSTRLSRRPR